MDELRAAFVREIALATLDKRPDADFHDVFCFVADCASLVWPEVAEIDMPRSAPVEDGAPAGPLNVADMRDRQEHPEIGDPGQLGPGVAAGANDCPVAERQAEEEFEADDPPAGEVSASPATPPRTARPGWQKVGTGPTILTAKAPTTSAPPKVVLPLEGEGSAWTAQMEEDMRRLRLDEGRGWNEVALQMGRSPGACQVRASDMKKRNKWFRKVTDQVLASGGGGSSLANAI